MVFRKIVQNGFRIVRRKSAETQQSDQIVTVITQLTEYCQVPYLVYFFVDKYFSDTNYIIISSIKVYDTYTIPTIIL